MPYARPTLTALRNQAIQDITTSGVPGLDGLLRNAVLRVLAWVMSGLAYSVYGYVDWTSLMGVPFTARDEYLEAWAALVNIYRKDATAATGNAQFTGQTGTPLRALIWLTAIQHADGSFPQNSWINGAAYWSGVQLDEIAAPLLLAWRLHQQKVSLHLFNPRVMMVRAAAYLIEHGPVTCQERWEEQQTIRKKHRRKRKRDNKGE